MRKLFLLFYLLGTSLATLAQQPVTGRIVAAADNSPLPGATVRLKDGATGVLTDENGYFILPAVPDKTVLQVSFLGFTTREVPLSLPLEKPLVIALIATSQHLQEVVVSTGYQQIPRERATGSFVHVDNATFREQAGPDVLSRLEAVANGVTVNKAGLSPQLMVRGISTINGPKAPLVVVDNFPYEGDLSNINPNDVESITILKDAAAASIWGARAGNGVIVITTKQGRYNQPLKAGVHASTSVSPRPDLDYLPQMTSSDFIDAELFLFGKGYYNSQLTSSSRPVVSPVVALLEQRRKGTLTAEEADARINALRQIDVRDDYNRYIYQPSVLQQYALSLSSGSQQLAWHLSAGYDHNKDHLDAGFSRLNLRLRNDLRLRKNLTVALGVHYTQSESTSGRQGYGQVGKSNQHLYPYARFADEAGNPLPIARDLNQVFKDTAGGGRLLDWNYYPILEHRHARTTSALQDVTGNLKLEYSWRHGLSAAATYQYERQQTAGRSLYDAQSYVARDLVNRFTQPDQATGAVRHIIPVGGILDLSQSLLEAQNLRGQLNYEGNWDKHTFSAIAGAEIRHARTTGSQNRRYGFNPDKLTTGTVDYATQYPDFVTGQLLFVPEVSGLHDKLNRFVSQFANAAYTYHNRYSLSMSARRDASNLFGQNTNDRWNPLWSAGLGWELSRETFYKLPLLPYLKLRTTYGFSGNTNPAFTAIPTITHLVASPFTQHTYARFATYANPDLTWETVGTWNLGLDFGSKNNRLSGSLEYYQKEARNLFALYPVDYTTGVGDQVIRNVATIRGKGLDLMLNSINIDRAFRWNTQLNFSTNRDEVADYYLGDPLAYNLVSTGHQVNGVVGKPVYAIFSYRWAGLDPNTGDPQGYLDGEASSDYMAIVYGKGKPEELVYHGSALPTVFGSLGNTFSWKGLSLTARLSWKLGYFFRARSIAYNTLYSNWGGHADFARRWKQPGDEQHTNIPSMIYPGNATRDVFYTGSEVLVERGDHIRLQYLTASYSFPGTQASPSWLSNVQVYANLSNPGILWRANNKGIDPDHFQLNALPLPASLTLGLKANF